MSFICNNCKSTFTKKTNLDKHIKTAKYCIQLREVGNTDSSTSICDICNTSFTSKYNLQKHFSSCSSHPGYVKLKQENIVLLSKLEDKDKTILDKDKLIDKLQRDIKDLSMEAINRPSHVTNNNNNTNNILIANLAPLNPDQLIKTIQDAPLTEDIYDEGLPAIATHYAKQLNNKTPPIHISDRSRRLITHKRPDGVLIKEKNGITLIKTLQPTILEQAKPIHQLKSTDYDIATKYNKLINTSIPNHQRYIKDAIQLLHDVSKYRKPDHPEISSANNRIKKLEDELECFLQQANELQSEAISRHLVLSDPDYHLDKMQKSATTFNSIKHLTDSKNSNSFANGLLDVFV
jgi:hypothetical protein